MTTCPGKTPFCDRYCYGLKGMFTLPQIKQKNEMRLEASEKSDFVPTIVEEIRKTRTPAFRLHVIGDFYSVKYIEKWIQIATILDDVIFFGSTRSWRCDFLSDPLKEFQAERHGYILQAKVGPAD